MNQRDLLEATILLALATRFHRRTITPALKREVMEWVAHAMRGTEFKFIAAFNDDRGELIVTIMPPAIASLQQAEAEAAEMSSLCSDPRHAEEIARELGRLYPRYIWLADGTAITAHIRH